MAIFHVLSPELGLFVVVLGGVIFLRKFNLHSISVVEGMVIYVPPQKEDFDALEESSKVEKKKKKGGKKHDKEEPQSKQASFPMRTFPVSEELLKYNQEFYEMYDFIFLLCFVSIVMFTIITTLSIIPVEAVNTLIQTNLTFYIMMGLVTAILCNLCKDSFNLGFFTYSNETKMEIMMAIKAFSIIFITLKSFETEEFFDFNLTLCHAKFNIRINQALEPFGVTPKFIPLEISQVFFSFLGAAISFFVVRINVKFAFYFFMFTSSDEGAITSEDDVATRTKKRLYKIQKVMMVANFIYPLLMVLLLVNPIVKPLLVPDYISQNTFVILKVLISIVGCGFRCLTFRKELQFTFNESYVMIQKLVIDKNEKLFQYIQLRIKENFMKVWFQVFQHMATIVVPLLLTCIYLSKYQQVQNTAAVSYDNAEKDGKMPEVFDFAQFRAAIANRVDPNARINIFDAENKSILTEVMQEIKDKGIMPIEYSLALIEFVLFWYFLASLFTTTMALLYYRKFKAV